MMIKAASNGMIVHEVRKWDNDDVEVQKKNEDCDENFVVMVHLLKSVINQQMQLQLQLDADAVEGVVVVVVAVVVVVVVLVG